MEIAKNLIQSCILHNRAAQKELYLKLLPYLRAVARRYLKDTSFEKDVLQESYVKIFRNISRFDDQKAPIKNWAARIVINTSINYNERIVTENTEEFLTEAHESVGLEAIEELSDSLLISLLKKMPKGYFEVFNMFVIDGYNHKEISAVLGIPETLSRKKLSRAKNWMRSAYAQHTS